MTCDPSKKRTVLNVPCSWPLGLAVPLPPLSYTNKYGLVKYSFPHCSKDQIDLWSPFMYRPDKPLNKINRKESKGANPGLGAPDEGGRERICSQNLNLVHFTGGKRGAGRTSLINFQTYYLIQICRSIRGLCLGKNLHPTDNVSRLCLQ